MDNFKIHLRVDAYTGFAFENSIGIELLRDPIDKRDALELSIEKWKLKLDLLEKNPTLNEVRGCNNESTASESASCGLCRLYLIPRKTDDLCEGCPIFEKTGQSLCGNTPVDRWMFDYDNEIDRVKAEIAFLEGLHA